MRFLIILLFSISFYPLIYSQNNIVNISKDNPLTYLGDNLLMFSEGHNKTHIEDILKNDTFFKSTNFLTLTTGNTDNRTIWVKFCLKNETFEDALIHIDPPLADSITLYQIENNQVINQSQTGLALPFSQRAIKSSNSPTLLLKGPKNQLATYILKIDAHFLLGIKLQVGARSAIDVFLERDTLFIGIFIGFILMVVVLNVSIFPAKKEILHLWYSAYLISILTLVCYNEGYLHKWLFYNTPQYNEYTYILTSIPGIFAIKFSMEFLAVQTISMRLYRFLNSMIVVSLINLGLAFLGYISFSVNFSYLIAIPITIIDIYIAYLAFKKGNISALYYIIGWAIMTVGISVFVMDNLNIFPHKISMKLVMISGIASEALFLTIAVMVRIGDLRKEKENFQAMLIQTLEQNKIIIAEQNQDLENKINERTEELVAALKREEVKEEKLKSSNKELTEFAHIVSHDLKAPLRNIASFVQLFNRRNKGKYDDLDREYMDYVLTSVKQSTNLIDDLLNYSKLDKNIGNPTPVKLNDNIYITLSTLNSYIKERNAMVQLNDLPVVLGHDSLIKQLFQNLIMNGMKYNESPHPLVKVGYSMKGQECIFWVKDNGIGIPPQYQEEVFRMFRRLHTADKYEGSGIGLAFCKRIIDTYEGRIWFESVEGTGTTFFFTLPKAPIVQIQRAESETQIVKAA